MNRHERETGQGMNYGCPIGSDTRRSHFPDRALRIHDWRAYGYPYGVRDELARKPLFACGEARTRGWAVMVWGNPYIRQIVKERIAASRALGPLPLP